MVIQADQIIPVYSHLVGVAVIRNVQDVTALFDRRFGSALLRPLSIAADPGLGRPRAST